MLLNKNVLRYGIGLGLLLSFVLSTVSPIKEYITYMSFAKDFVFEGKTDNAKHVITKNISADLVEEEYLNVQKILNAGKINNTVIVIKVSPDARGIIGICDKDEVYGVYNNNIIVYNGEQATLQHELAHFFFEKTHPHTRSEIFAQTIEGIFYMLRTRK